MVQAEWNGQKWEISKEKVRPVSSLEIENTARTKTDSENDVTVFVGRGLELANLTFKTSTMTGGDPAAERAALDKLVGTAAPLYVGEEQIGENDMLLRSAEISNAVLNGEGAIIAAEITLDFVEKANPGSDTGIKIIYSGKNIAGDVSIAACWVEHYAEDHADVLEIRFSDPKKEWDGWAKEGMTGEEIRVEYGNINTGKLYVHSVKPDGAVFVLKAMSIPPTALNPASKSWEEVTLEMIAEEIAGRHGLTFKSFNTKGTKRAYVRQDNQADLVFLSRRCKMEGAAFLVYDGALVLYDEQAREAENPSKVMGLDASTTIFTAEDNTAAAFHSCAVENGECTGTHTDADVPGDAVLLKQIDDKLASDDEALGIAKGYLRQANKWRKILTVERDLFAAVCAGSTVKIETKKASSWAGAVYVFRMRHDLVKNRSKIWARRPLKW
jgi:uncharacterized protein